MSLIDLADARLRGIALPADNGAAQDIIDEEESWLARRIGPLTGSRVETFYVGLASPGKLGLRRYTDSVAVSDNGHAVTTFRLIDNGSAVVHSYDAASRYWTGPYVAITYTPSDEDEVRKALYELLTLAVEPAGTMNSESIGDYSYSRGAANPAHLRSVIVSSLLPKRDANTTVYTASRILHGHDPVINRAEAVW